MSQRRHSIAWCSVLAPTTPGAVWLSLSLPFIKLIIILSQCPIVCIITSWLSSHQSHHHLIFLISPLPLRPPPHLDSLSVSKLDLFILISNNSIFTKLHLAHFDTSLCSSTMQGKNMTDYKMKAIFRHPKKEEGPGHSYIFPPHHDPGLQVDCEHQGTKFCPKWLSALGKNWSTRQQDYRHHHRCCCHLYNNLR